jgi:hypothetical protein
MAGNDCTLVLRTGGQLSRRAVSCPTGEYTVVHQHDGDVVLYRNADAAPIWATDTAFQPGIYDVHGERTDTGTAYGRPGRLLLREDGDLVVLSAAGEQLWASGMAAKGVTSLMIHDWGKLVLRNDRGHILWQTGKAPRRWDGWNAVPDGRRLRRGQTLRGQTLTSDNGRYTFGITFDGAAYLCRAGGAILWTAFISSGDGLEMTEDGGLASRSPDGIFRPGNGIGVPHDLNAAEFFVSDDGRLTFAGDDGQILWAGQPATPDPADQLRRVSGFH